MLAQGHYLVLIFFLELAAGGALTLLFTPSAEKVGANFYRMMAAVYGAAAFIGLSVAWGKEARAALSAKSFLSTSLSLPASSGGPVSLWLFSGLFAAAAGVCLLQPRPLRRWVWALLAAAGFILLVDLVPVFTPAGATPLLRGLQAASFFASALSLGGVMSAMLLGHWYLVTPTLSMQPLKNLVVLTAFSLVAQGAILVAGLLAASRGPDAALVQLVVARANLDALCFWVRVLVGLIGGLVLAAMTWHTLQKWKATTAATGILYVAVIAVLLGEATGRYLLAFRQLPL